MGEGSNFVFKGGYIARFLAIPFSEPENARCKSFKLYLIADEFLCLFTSHFEM